MSFDEDDVSISVFATFCDRLQAKLLPEVRDREGLWRLLILMTARKVNDHAKMARAKKRLNAVDAPDVALDNISELRDTAIEPSLEIMMQEQCQQMLKVGDEFCGCKILEVLGQGAMGIVFWRKCRSSSRLKNSYFQPGTDSCRRHSI